MPKGVKDMSDEAKAKREAEKAAKFIELANKRVGAALEAIGKIAGLSAKGNYSYTEAQVKAIGQALVNKVNTTMAPFISTKASATGFDLEAATAPAEALKE